MFFKFQFISLALLFAVCSSCSGSATTAHVSAPPSSNTHLGMQNIILLQAKMAPECTGKCTMVVEPTSSTSSARPEQAPPPPLRAPLRPWNTLTVDSEDTNKYQAKIECSKKCQATTGSDFFPLWASPTSKGPETEKHQLATLTLHTSHRTTKQTNVYISSMSRGITKNTKQHNEQLPAIVVIHIPSTRAVCHVQKAKSSLLLKISILLAWIAGCPLIAWLVSISISSSKPCWQ